MNQSSKRVTFILLFLAAILLLGGCGAAPATASSSKVSSVISSSSSSEVKAEILPTVASLEIDASALSDQETIAETFNDSLTAWYNAGATPENAKVALASGDLNAYATKIASEYDDLFESALTDPNGQSDLTANTSEWIANVKKVHVETLVLYYDTSFPSFYPDDKVPYKRSSKLDNVVSFKNNSDGTSTLVEAAHEFDNSDQNRVGEGSLTSGKAVTGGEEEPTIVFSVVNGKVKVQSLAFAQ